MPRHTRRAGNRPLTSSPSKMIAARTSAAKKPLIRLKNVVLPAPFGPMTARNSPDSTVIDTLLTATRLPKFLETFSTCNRLMTPPFAVKDAKHAARKEQHHEYEK